MTYRVSPVDKIVINGVKGLTIRSAFCSTCIMSGSLTRGLGSSLVSLFFVTVHSIQINLNRCTIHSVYHPCGRIAGVELRGRLIWVSLVR